jgi:uncharacterized damage-inducible protein DinB
VNDAAGVEQRTRRLQAAVEGVLGRVERLGEDQLYRRPADGEWTVMENLAHLAELMPYWSRQAREVAARAENNQPFGRTHEDPDRIGAVERHADDRLDQVLPRIRDGLAEATATMRELTAEGWAKTARHRNRGEMTVTDILDQFLIDHVEEHAQQIESTLASVGG